MYAHQPPTTINIVHKPSFSVSIIRTRTWHHNPNPSSTPSTKCFAVSDCLWSYYIAPARPFEWQVDLKYVRYELNGDLSLWLVHHFLLSGWFSNRHQARQFSTWLEIPLALYSEWKTFNALAVYRVHRHATYTAQAWFLESLAAIFRVNLRTSTSNVRIDSSSWSCANSSLTLSMHWHCCFQNSVYEPNSERSAASLITCLAQFSRHSLRRGMDAFERSLKNCCCNSNVSALIEDMDSSLASTQSDTTPPTKKQEKCDALF